MSDALGAVCRCVCGGGARPEAASGPGCDFDGVLPGAECVEQLPLPLSAAEALSFLDSPEQPLRGEPTKTGELWHLQDEERIGPVTFSLYVNGYTVAQGDSGRTEVVALSPFALVRNCTLAPQVGASALAVDISELKIFKLSFYTRNSCTFYGVKATGSADADAERQSWVHAISTAVQLVSQSLYPPFHISCQPLKSSASTARRLMAGYLLYHEGEQLITVLYCELSSHCSASGCAQLAVYQSECCQRRVMTLSISVQTKCVEKIGINCPCFAIDEHNFSARTCSERKLWLRAVSNLRVKLQNEAPTPSREELAHFRAAIEEHVASLRDSLGGPGRHDPVLQAVPRSCRAARAPSGAPPGRAAAGGASAALRPPSAEGSSGVLAASPAPEAAACQDGGTGGSAEAPAPGAAPPAEGPASAEAPARGPGHAPEDALPALAARGAPPAQAAGAACGLGGGGLGAGPRPARAAACAEEGARAEEAPRACGGPRLARAVRFELGGAGQPPAA